MNFHRVGLVNYSRTGESGTRYSSIRSDYRRCLKRAFLWWKKQPRSVEEGSTSENCVVESCLVVKQDGLSLVVSIAVDLLEQVPVGGRRFPRKQSVGEGRCQPSGKSP